MISAPAPKSDSDLPLLLVIAGPTGSGKTALSLALASRLNGEIISCDSVAVYRGMNIGSAKPTVAEQASVPHHLIDVTTPDQPYTAGDYARAARTAAREIAARGRTPIVTGGTGLYLRALLDGLSPLPPRDEALRARLRSFSARRDPVSLHRVLRRLDPAAALAIHPNDTPKLIRALELNLLANQPVTEAWQHTPPEPLTGFRIVQYALNPARAQLYDRINARCAAMFARGLVEETRALIEQYGTATAALQALGYAQAAAVVRGELGLADAVVHAQQGHRNYAKRQLTWFRKDERIRWLHAFGEQALATVVAGL